MCVNYGIDSAYREDEHEEKTGVSVRGLCGGCPVFRVRRRRCDREYGGTEKKWQDRGIYGGGFFRVLLWANEGSVRVKRSEVEDGTAYLTIQYDSAETFSDFNGIECFSGSIVQAQAEGYDFDMDFVQVGGEEDEPEGSSLEAAIQPVVPGETVTGDDELKVLIIRSHVDVRVPGEIAYVSDHVNVEGGDTVRADEDDGSAEHDVLLYVLYK